jgi:hypothetical protein
MNAQFERDLDAHFDRMYSDCYDEQESSEPDFDEPFGDD